MDGVNSRRRIPFVVLAVCLLLSFALSMRRAWENVVVDPTMPPDVCPLVRPETFDILVPQHGSLRASSYDEYPGQRSSACETSGLSPVDGLRVEIGVWIIHYGRRDGAGPSCVDSDEQWFYAQIVGQLPLGDRAGYLIRADPNTKRNRIHLSICLGTYKVVVEYAVAGVTDADMIESASTVGLEVLSRRTGTALFPPLRHWPVILGTLR